MANDGIALPDFTRGIEKLANEILVAQLGEQHGKHAVARLMTAMRTAARRSPDILRCAPETVAEALAMCIMTEMLPGGAQPPVYLLPRNNKVKDANGREHWRMELQFQLSFRGMRQLAARAGMFPSVTLVYEGDIVIREVLDASGRWYVPDGEQPLALLVGGWELGPMERLRFIPGGKDRTYPKLRGAFVSTTRRVGDRTTYEGTVVLGSETIDKRKQSSDSVKKGFYSPWKGWEEEMVFKTCVRYWAARSAEFDDVGRRAFELHDTTEPIDVEWRAADETQAQQTGRAALGLGRRDAPALPDHGEPEPSFQEQGQRLAQRQTVAREDDAEAQRRANEAAAARDAAQQQTEDDGAP